MSSIVNAIRFKGLSAVITKLATCFTNILHKKIDGRRISETKF